MLNTIAILVIFISAPLVFAMLYFYTAPYGRHYRGGWGPTVPERAGWIVMEAPALLVIGIVVLANARSVSLFSFLLLGLWEIHYLYRTCLFPLLMRESEKRFPIVIIGFAFIFNSLNGYANGLFLASAPLPVGGFWPGFRACIGVALFAGGFVTHVWADRDLRHLRAPGEFGYKIPRGGLFNLVSSPNYFGEIAEWCGWALAAWSVPGLGFALFTIANLVPRAHANRAMVHREVPRLSQGTQTGFPLRLLRRPECSRSCVLAIRTRGGTIPLPAKGSPMRHAGRRAAVGPGKGLPHHRGRSERAHHRLGGPRGGGQDGKAASARLPRQPGAPRSRGPHAGNQRSEEALLGAPDRYRERRGRAARHHRGQRCRQGGKGAPVLLMAPPPLAKLDRLADMFDGGTEKSRHLGRLFGELAKERGCAFLDTGPSSTRAISTGFISSTPSTRLSAKLSPGK